MKIIIFAGGAGTRLWPLSRQNSPKQFATLKDNQSTLQMAVNRIKDFGFANTFIATNSDYVKIVSEQVPEILPDHIMTEPVRRDLAAAVGLALFRLKARGESGTVAMLWADHFMDKPQNFVDALKQADSLLAENPKQLIFLGEKARFPNHNLGWIKLGKQNSGNAYEFSAWKYRPEIQECEEMFASHDWVWNTGYFVFDIDFVVDLYKKHQPEMAAALEKMIADETLVVSEYPKLFSTSFDQAIVEKIDTNQAVVLKVNLGWSDPGTLYALKEALSPTKDSNYLSGNTVAQETKDSLLYNEEVGKLVVGIGLESLVVVNTKDTLLVCHKDKVPEIKAVLKKIEEQGLQDYL